MARYSRTFAPIGRAKAADYRRRRQEASATDAPLIALVARRDALIAALAAQRGADARQALRAALTSVLAEIDRRYGR